MDLYRMISPFSSHTTVNYVNLVLNTRTWIYCSYVLSCWTACSIASWLRRGLFFPHVQVAAKPPITEVSARVLPLPLQHNYFETVSRNSGLCCSSSWMLQQFHSSFMRFGHVSNFTVIFLIPEPEMTEFEFPGLEISFATLLAAWPLSSSSSLTIHRIRCHFQNSWTRQLRRLL